MQNFHGWIILTYNRLILSCVHVLRLKDNKSNRINLGYIKIILREKLTWNWYKKSYKKLYSCNGQGQLCPLTCPGWSIEWALFSQADTREIGKKKSNMPEQCHQLLFSIWIREPQSVHFQGWIRIILIIMIITN